MSVQQSKGHSILALLMLAACFCPAIAKDANAGIMTSAKSLALYNWSTSTSPSLADIHLSQEVAQSFVRSVEISIFGDSNLGEVEQICSFRFADLRHDSVLSLIVGIGGSINSPCNGIYIIDKSHSRFDVYSIAGVPGTGDEVPSMIVDLRKNGRLELLVDTELASIPGGCTASFTSIFAWTGDTYADVSSEYRDYYQTKLFLLNKEISKHKPDEQMYEQPVCAEVEAAAIQRYLGISSSAGLEQATRLAKSGEYPLREFAARLLSEFDAPQSRKALELLSKDPVSSVAYAAKVALSNLAAGKPMFVEISVTHCKQKAPLQF